MSRATTTSHEPRNYLQPYHVFMAELWRLNRLYWTSKYALERVPPILAAISSTASSSADPPVAALWTSADTRMRQNLTIPLSAYAEYAATAIESMRAVAIVGICSAFENALVNYFILACLYHPKQALANWNHAAVPKILKNTESYARLQKRAAERAAEVLRAGYATRVHVLLDTFDVQRSTLEIPENLARYYAGRHLVAHNQGVEEDGPWLPPDELVSARFTLDEAAWRQMLGDFDSLVIQVDTLMQTTVPARGLHLAVHWIMEHSQNGPVTLGKLRNKVNTAWHVDASIATIQQIATEIGYRVSSEKHPIRRHVRAS